jgi:hypothetical protein
VQIADALDENLANAVDRMGWPEIHAFFVRRSGVEQRSRNIQLIEGLVLKSNIPTVEKLFTENLPSERKEYLQSIFVALRKRYPHLA